jgi:ribulose-5-phosphate 4-epimerase/fuculose-1-phosphate aldolase
LKMKLKGLHFAGAAEIQETCNWSIKEGPKRGIFGSVSETVQPRKSLYIRQWSLFWIKKKGMCLRFLKKSVLKLLDHTVYVHSSVQHY